MSFSMSHGLTQTAVIVGLGCFLGGSWGVIVQSAATETVSAAPAAISTAVNRMHKADRLVLTIAPAPASRSDRKDSGPTGLASSAHRRPPVGCDPAFSPIAAPELGHIFKRCIA